MQASAQSQEVLLSYLSGWVSLAYLALARRLRLRAHLLLVMPELCMQATACMAGLLGRQDSRSLEQALSSVQGAQVCDLSYCEPQDPWEIAKLGMPGALRCITTLRRHSRAPGASAVSKQAVSAHGKLAYVAERWSRPCKCTLPHLLGVEACGSNVCGFYCPIQMEWYHVSF